MSRIERVAAGLIAATLLCSPAIAQVQRSFVASYGNDANTANNCSLAMPCRGFAAAHGVTNSGGEIIALDAAGYGAITIIKSINIIGNPGFYAGVFASAGTAVTIATAGVEVRLSGLKINSIGAATGISMTDGTSLTVENCTVSGFSGNGIEVSAAGAKLRVLDTLLLRNGGNGVFVGNGVKADITRTTAIGNIGSGIAADNTDGTLTTVAVTNSVSSENFCGFWGHADGTTNASVTKMSVSGSTADHNVFAGVYSGTLGANGTSTVYVAQTQATNGFNGFIARGTNGILVTAQNSLVEGNQNNVMSGNGGVVNTTTLK